MSMKANSQFTSLLVQASEFFFAIGTVMVLNNKIRLSD